MEELKAKLITYEKSYAQIKEALQEEPNNEQLLKLKKERLVMQLQKLKLYKVTIHQQKTN